MSNNSEMLIYTTEDGLTKTDITFDDETVWLSIDQMSSLFQRDRSTISRHIKNIYRKCGFAGTDIWHILINKVSID